MVDPSRGNSPVAPEDTLHLPRILCLHGGGVNADVFRAQARALIRHLPDFRLVFADGPFFCDAGPGIVPVYEDCGPFRRWLRWLPDHPEVDDDTAIEEIMYSINSCKKDDEGTGAWVGIIGFSQGAKLAASLLYDQQIRFEKEGKADTDYKFGVLLAGRGPLISFCDYSRNEACVRPGAMSEVINYVNKSGHVLRIPTLHVHGLADKGLHLHQLLLEQYMDPKMATLIQWDGGAQGANQENRRRAHCANNISHGEGTGCTGLREHCFNSIQRLHYRAFSTLCSTPFNVSPSVVRAAMRYSTLPRTRE